MRLTTDQQRQIKQLVQQEFGDEARVLLFGSRVDDTAKGGDIDLLIQTHHPVARPALQAACLSAAISRVVDERKIDVLIHAPNLKTLPIHQVAKSSGVDL